MRYLAILVAIVLAASCSLDTPMEYSAMIRVDNRAPFEVCVEAGETLVTSANTVSAYETHIFEAFPHNPDKVIEIFAKAGDAPFARYGQLSIYPDEKYTIRVVYDPLAGCYAITAIED
jgi:hypothetical protein